MKKIINLNIYITIILVGKLYAANPDEDCCEPSIESQSWEPTTSTGYNLDSVAQKITNILKFIPGGVTPHLSGSISIANFSKTGCCSSTDEDQKTLNKVEISGTAGVGVNTGILPIPGLSLPFRAGGAFISASTSVSVTLSGTSEGNCGSGTAEEKIVSGSISQPITLAGGANAWGESIMVFLEGSAQISGGVELSSKSGWKPTALSGSAKADLVFSSKDWEIVRVNIVGS